MKKEDKEKEILKLELEKLKIQHASELAYINQLTWLKVTIIIGLVFTIVTSIWEKIPRNFLLPSIFLIVIYVILLFDVARYTLISDFYGKPKKFYDKILYYIFLDFIFRKNKGLIKTYNERIDELKNRLKK